MRLRSSARRLLAGVLAACLCAGGAAAAQPRAGAPAAAAPKLTKPPALVHFVEAPYPDSERAAGKVASVVLRIGIGATGTVSDVAVVESAGAAFDAAATQAARGFLFEPAEIDGKPAAIRILYKYEFVLKQEVPTTAIFEGVVRDRKTKAPLAGVTIELDSGGRATTGEDGRFHFADLPPGTQGLTLSGEGLTALRTEEKLEAGKRLDATYDVEPKAKEAAAGEEDDLEIVIVAPPIEKQVVTTEISASEGRKVPGTQGDVLKVVESLPGVGRSSAGSAALVVWGAAPQDTRVYVDGVHIPRLYHDGGLRSVVHSDLVKAVELSPGGYGSSYGRGLGGLVTVDLRPLEDDGFHGSVAGDLIDTAAAVRVPVTSKLRVAVAARRSYLDSLLPVFTSTDVGDLFPIPRYHDGQARIAYEPSKSSYVELGGMISSDSIERTVASQDPSLRKSEARDARFNRVYVHYKAQVEGGGEVNLVPSFGTDSSSLLSRFGATPTELGTESEVFGLRATWRGSPIEDLRMTVGVDAEAVSSSVERSGSVTSPPREGDVRVFGQPPSDQINADTWEAVVASVAAFAEADVALLGGALHVVPGLRIEPYVVTGSRRTPVVGETPSIGFYTEDTAVEPRLAVHASLSPRVLLKAAYGLYHQPPVPEDLSAVFGNPLLETSAATHWLFGTQVKLADTLSVETTTFYSKSSALAARSPSPSPLLAKALVQDGEGRAYGAQILVRKELSSRIFGWMSYSILRSERRLGPEGRYRLFDFDQTHVLTALASYNLGAGFEIGARFRYATGFPRTPVTGAYYDARTDTYQPLFGSQSSDRIPAFVQVDVRASKQLKVGPTEMEAYLDVQNVTNRENPEEVVYSQDYSRKDYITGFPILPVVGLRCSW